MGSNSYGRDFGDSRVYYGYKKKEINDLKSNGISI
jgi:hypothetical protein